MDAGHGIGGLLAALDRAPGGVRGLAQVGADRGAQALGLDGLTLSLRACDALEVVWWDEGDRTGVALEDLQFTVGEGPTVDAGRSGQAVVEADLGQVPATRWSAFLPRALPLGVRSVLAVPVQLGAVRPGVLTGYRTEPGALSLRQMTDVLALAEAICSLLLTPACGESAPEPSRTSQLPQLQRGAVHQAAGLLAVRLQIPIDQALIRLRARALAEGRPLLDAAHDLLVGHTTLSSTDD